MIINIPNKRIEIMKIIETKNKEAEIYKKNENIKEEQKEDGK